MAKLSVIVKPEGLISKGVGLALTPTWKQFGKKLKEEDEVFIQIDDDRYILQASETSYVFDIQPGKHIIAATDINEGKKFGVGTAMRTAVHLGIGLASGSLLQSISNGVNGAKESHDRAKANYSHDEFTVFDDSETVEYRCQATAQGVVKLKRIF